MNRALKLVIVLALGMIFITGCKTEKSREERLAGMISKMDSPFFIMNTNPQNLMDKSGVMDGVLPFTYELILSFFIDESVTGIDYDTDAQLIVTKGSGFTPDFYAIFKVKKDETFRELLEKEANAEILEKDGFNYAIKKSDSYALVWNEEFAILSNIPIDLTAMFTGNGGDQGMKVVDKCIGYIKGADEGEANQEYIDFLKKEDDIAMHFDGEGFFKFYEDMSLVGDNDLKEMKDIFEGMDVDYTINFNNGDVVMQWESELAEELLAKLNFIQETGVDQKLLTYGNGRDPIMVGSYNVQIQGAMDYLEGELPANNLDKMKEDLAKMGLNWDELSSSITGQLVYMVDGYEKREVVYDYGYGESYTDTREEPIFAVVAGVGKADYFSDMLAAGEPLANGVIKLDDAYIALKNDIFFVSNDSAWASKAMAGTTTKVNDLNNVLTENPFGMYFDFNALSKMEDLNDLEPYVNLMVSFHGSADLSGGKFVFTMKDDSKNSLRILTETVSDALNKFDEMMNPDIQEDLESAIEESLEDLEDDMEGIDTEALEDGINALEEGLKELENL